MESAGVVLREPSLFLVWGSVSLLSIFRNIVVPYPSVFLFPLPHMRRSPWILLLVVSLLVAGLPAAPASAQTTIADARDQGDGSTVTVEGVVTRALGDFVRFQDTSGPTGASGLVVRQTSGAFNNEVQDGTITRGTQIRVEGTLSTFNGLLQINEDDLASYTVLGPATVPDPQSVTLSDLRTDGEDYESELVSISDLELLDDVDSFSGDVTYEVVEAGQTNPFDLRVQSSDESEVGGTPAPPTTFDYVGVVGQFDRNNSTTTGYQLIPVLRSDIQGAVFFSFARAYNVSLEGDGTTTITVQAQNVKDGESVSVSIDASGSGTADLSTDVSSINPSTLTFNDADPAPQSVTLTLTDDGVTEGVEYLQLTLTSSDGPSGGTFTQWILDDATSQGPIAEGEEGSGLITQLESTYGGAETLDYDGGARDTLFAVVYGAQDDSLRTVYSDYSKFIPSDADPTIAACNFDPSTCTESDDINTEHAWPQSLGSSEEPARGDMHILFPARGDVNGDRLTYPFAEIDDADADRWYLRETSRTTPPTNSDLWSKVDFDNQRFEPRSGVKGDIARAILYFITMYPDRADLDFFRTQKSTMLQWHADDPVDADEMRRNVLQASYQENRLNPYVVDPTLADRAFGVVGAPTDIVAAPGSDNVQLRWTEPLSGEVVGYNVYRSTEDFTATGDAQQVNTGGPVSATSFTDSDVQVGGAYVYRVTAVDDQGTESNLSASADAVVYPSTIPVAIDRSFGDVTQGTSYRLVALPGNVDAAVGSNLGEPGTDWTALWDDGSDSDFLVRFDGSDTFRFQPGRGFWLLSSSNWTVDESIATVRLSSQEVTIPLHDGWNIISNPLPVGLIWSDVSAANGGNLQPVWAWDGAFQEAVTFRSAQSGEAFYFLNDGGLSELTLPLSAADLSGSADARSNLAANASRFTLEAELNGFTSRVALGESPDAERGRDPLDVVAPPQTGFATVSLRIAADGPERQQYLARDIRAPSEDGHRYTIVLASPGDEAVTLRATGLPEGPDAAAVLVNGATGERHTLTGDPLRVTPSTERSTYRLLLGKASFTGAPEANADELLIEKPAPNPFRDRTTLRYTLPEAQDVTIRVYDLLGRRLLTLVDGRQASGPHSVQWGGTDASGAPIASGMYFVRMSVGDRRVVHKVVHVR